MRQISIRKLVELKLITDLGEAQATSKLAVCKTNIFNLEVKVSRVQNQAHTGKTVTELKQVETWKKWRTQELFRLMNELAILRVELEEAKHAAGKAIAKNAVVSNLITRQNK